jgi:outer membrane biosynthesis protein TonB
MPTPDDDMLGPGLEKRLKAALDEVVPPSPHLSSARYRMGAAKQLSRAWRFAPALVAIGAAGAVLTATAATGSPNAAVWRDLAGAMMQNVSHFPGANPKATKSPKPQPRASAPAQGIENSHPTPTSGHEFEPKPSPEPTDKPKPESSPNPPHEQPGPSPTAGGSHHSEPSPSPSPEPTH